MRVHSELSTTTCHSPMLKLYQPLQSFVQPGCSGVAELPKYVKYPPAPLVPYSWLPTTGRVIVFRRPHDGS